MAALASRGRLRRPATGATGNRCGSNLRSIALANAIRAHLQDKSLLQEIVERAPLKSILEINEAGSLSPFLHRFNGHVLAAYPEVDLHCLPYSDASFDPGRPLRHAGACRQSDARLGGMPSGADTGRRTLLHDPNHRRPHEPRSGRTGEELSGNPEARSDDFTVRTEFGADAWTYLMEAGFSSISIHAVGYPAATAFLRSEDMIRRRQAAGRRLPPAPTHLSL